ncbi:putative 30S ribosomal protein S16, partial [Tribonema minus]
MVVRLRLQRFGHKNQPFYRVVAADARAPRDGKFIEIVGTYNPIPTRDGYKEVRFNRQRIEYWLGVGAEPSERVAWLLGQFNILPLVPRRIFTQNHLPKKERAELLA